MIPLTALPPRQPRVVPTNSLILLLPTTLFAPSLLPLFEAHFNSYGPLVAWTPLASLGRVLVVYEDAEGATAARREMDGFIWEDDVRDPVASTRVQGTSSASNEVVASSSSESDASTPLRAFFGPALSLPLPSLHSTLLSVPALSRNFLISPPGSPPVGWEQTLEEAPNVKSLPEDPASGGGWGEELERALRFLSVGEGADDDAEEGGVGRTHTIVQAKDVGAQPAITLSSPPERNDEGEDSTRRTAGISDVKATIESMLGRRKSLSLDDLDLGRDNGRTITPTARPPTSDEAPYLES